MTIRQIDVLLLRISGKRDIPDGAIAQRLLGNERFFDELTFRREYLDSVILTIADVEQTVSREFGAVNWIAELLGWRGIRIVTAEAHIARLVAVGAPKPFEFTGVGVDHRHAFVAIAIGD